MKKIEWVSQIKLSRNREAETESWFSAEIEFHYPQTVDKPNKLLEDFKRLSNNELSAKKSIDFDNQKITFWLFYS